MIEYYQFFLTLGIAENGKSNCDHVELLTQAKNAIPKGFTGNVFCGYNSVDEDATCKGDSGKYVTLCVITLNYGFSLCPIHVVTFTLISSLVTDYIQKRRGQALLSSFEYNLSPKLISK